MKRPRISPADIGVGVPDASGAVTIVLKDAAGNTQEVLLSPSLRASLGQRLMSESLAETAKDGISRLFFRPTRTRVYVTERGDQVVELQTENGRAIHVMLPGLMAEALLLQLREIVEPGPGAKTH